MDPMDSGEIHASIEVDVGTTLDATAVIISRLESIILSHEAVERVNSKIEKWHATIYIKMKEEYKFKVTSEELIDDLKKMTKPVQSAFLYFNESAEQDSSKELDVLIFGPDPEKLKDLANELSAKIKQNILDVDMVVLRFRPGKPSLEIHPKNIELARAGITAAQLGGVLRSSLFGSIASKFYDKDKEVDIRIRVNPVFVDTPKKVKAMYINRLKENHTTIDTLAYFSSGDEETKIYRLNKRRMVTITAKFRKMDINKAGNAISALLDAYPFEKDYKYELGESFAKLQKSQSQVLIITMLSIILIYLLLGTLFESVSWPFLIIATVPLCVLFTVICLVFANSTLNMSVYIGLILMGGIVVNNTILVVSTIKHKLLTSHYSSELVFSAIKERVRPITMSTITNVLGMAPLIFDYKEGSNLWRPLATTLTIGILFSLIVSMFLIPVIYRVSKTWKFSK
jgi:HAE1 family hydrophobic/amphiphilic exporter-1